MPITHLLHPKTNNTLSFEDGPAILEREGIMPSYAVKAIIEANQTMPDDVPSFFVRPSDVQPTFTCRRQRVWKSNHDYGINPLDAESMLEGSAFHSQLGAMEIDVPKDTRVGSRINDPIPRLEVCGVIMRGRIDWLFDDRIEDLKTTTPFWIGRYPPKDSETRWPIAVIWEKDTRDAEDIEKWKIQLSLYRALLLKSGQSAPSMGRVWRRYSGVKTEMRRWKLFNFPLFTEEELEKLVGEWMRSLQSGLTEAKIHIDAWKTAPADGREMVGSKGNMWQCDRCPLKEECFLLDKLEVF